jgi:dynein heavy chain
VVSNRHDDSAAVGDFIQKLLLDSNKILRISKGAQSWKTYVDYIAGIVIEGVAETIAQVVLKLTPNRCQPIPN